jgi:hypothetical protein
MTGSGLLSDGQGDGRSSDALTVSCVLSVVHCKKDDNSL